MANHIVNDKELASMVEEYLQSNEFSKPLVVIGHVGIGKAAILKREVNKKEKVLKLRTPLWMECPDSSNEIVRFRFDTATEAVKDFAEVLRIFKNHPTIVTIADDWKHTLNLYKFIASLKYHNMQWVYYLENKKDFLSWAREADEDGYQNIDELVCKYIETTSDYEWSFGLSRVQEVSDSKDDINRVESILYNLRNGEELSNADLSFLKKCVAEDTISDLRMVFATPSNWKYANRMIKYALLDLLDDNIEKYNACFSETKHVRELEDGSKEEYLTKNLDIQKLEQQLNLIDENKWFKRTIVNENDSSEQLRKNDRLRYFMHCLVPGEIKSHTGCNISKQV